MKKISKIILGIAEGLEIEKPGKYGHVTRYYFRVVTAAGKLVPRSTSETYDAAIAWIKSQ